MFAFDVRRIGRGPLLVVWEQRDPFDGEDQPPVDFDRAWGAPTAAAVDALGRSQALRVFDGRIRVAVSCTPIFITTAT